MFIVIYMDPDFIVDYDPYLRGYHFIPLLYVDNDQNQLVTAHVVIKYSNLNRWILPGWFPKLGEEV